MVSYGKLLNKESKSCSQFTEAEELEAILAAQDLVTVDEEIDIAEYLKDDEDDKSLQHVVTEVEIEKREKERIPKKIRQIRQIQAWARSRNRNIQVLQEKYPFVPSELPVSETSPDEVNYWLTRFILEIMKEDGTPYPTSIGNSLYNIACGLLRHFREDLERFDLNILAKNKPEFQSFRNALASRMKEMTALGRRTGASPLSKDDERQLWD